MITIGNSKSNSFTFTKMNKKVVSYTAGGERAGATGAETGASAGEEEQGRGEEDRRGRDTSGTSSTAEPG